METATNIKINSLLKSARVVKQMSQVEVGKRLGYKNGQFISNWERGLSMPPISKVKDLCKLYGIEKKKMIGLYIKAKLNEIS